MKLFQRDMNDMRDNLIRFDDGLDFFRRLLGGLLLSPNDQEARFASRQDSTVVLRLQIRSRLPLLSEH